MAKAQRFFGTSRGLGPHAWRRGLLQAGLAIGTLALGQRVALGQSGGAHVHMPELGVAKLPVVAAMDQPLVEPEVRRSVNGVLSTSLHCAYAYRDIGGMRLYLRSYEGGLAPTLRMKPGETLKIRLTNDFPPNRDLVPSIPSYPHQFNNTNLHFHGAHCSPSGIADNVMRLMEPGKSYDIEIPLPADHTRGTYWYHPHFHGSADVQVASGMAGAIVVEGDFADVPEIAQARERVILLTQVVFDAFSMIEDFGTLFPETATRFLAINGQRRPTIDMRPGQVQRWRLVGSQYQDNMLLELDQHRLNVIAYDGIQLGALQETKQHRRARTGREATACLFVAAFRAMRAFCKGQHRPRESASALPGRFPEGNHEAHHQDDQGPDAAAWQGRRDRVRRHAVGLRLPDAHHQRPPAQELGGAV